MKLIAPYILLTMLMVFAACKPDNARISKSFEDWQGSKVEIPSDLVYTILNDTIEFNVNDCDYKVLHYVDSIGCAACKLTLPAWEQFMSEVMTNQDISVKLILIVNTSKPFDVYNSLKKYRFKYPIAIDTKNTFSSMNNLDEDQTTHTFLLNDNNEVVLIGNPVQNNDIKNLYLKELDILNNDTTSIIKMTPTSLIMGVFSPDEEKGSRFRLFNSGDIPILVNDIYTSCDCTSAWTEQDTIYPNSHIEVHVKCRAIENDSDFIRYVYVSLSNNETLSLPLCGFITKRKDKQNKQQY